MKNISKSKFKSYAYSEGVFKCVHCNTSSAWFTEIKFPVKTFYLCGDCTCKATICEDCGLIEILGPYDSDFKIGGYGLNNIDGCQHNKKTDLFSLIEDNQEIEPLKQKEKQDKENKVSDDHYRAQQIQPIHVQEQIIEQNVNVPIKARHLICMAIKHIIRCGQKRDNNSWEKELRKAINYLFRALTGKWIHEVDNIEKYLK